MKTQDYLSQIERLDRMIQNKLSEIYQLKTMMFSVTASNDGERVQVSSEKDRLGNTVAKIVDLEKKTETLVDEYTQKRSYIIKQIDQLTNIDYYHVLSKRYVSRNTFKEISESTNWSIRKVFDLHENAIKEFEKLYGKEYL